MGDGEKPGAVPPLSKSDLLRGAGALMAFKGKVDRILRELDGSSASKSNIAWQTIDRSAFSGTDAEFAEAEGLASMYNAVHTDLVDLSRNVAEQLEGIGIAVRAADIGFENLEDDQRARFWAIQRRAQERFDALQKIPDKKDTGATGTGA